MGLLSRDRQARDQYPQLPALIFYLATGMQGSNLPSYQLSSSISRQASKGLISPANSSHLLSRDRQARIQSPQLPALIFYLATGKQGSNLPSYQLSSPISQQACKGPISPATSSHLLSRDRQAKVQSPQLPALISY